MTESDEPSICTLSIRIFVFLKAYTYSVFPLTGTVRVGRGRCTITDQMMQYHQKSRGQFKQDQWNTRMRCNLEGKFCHLVSLTNKIQSINSHFPSAYSLVTMSDFAIYNKGFMQQWMVLVLQVLWPFNESTKTFMSVQSDSPSDNWGIDMPGVSGDIDRCGTEGLVSDGERGWTHIDLWLHFIGLFILFSLLFSHFSLCFPLSFPFSLNLLPSPHNIGQATVSQLSRAERD